MERFIDNSLVNEASLEALKTNQFKAMIIMMIIDQPKLVATSFYPFQHPSVETLNRNSTQINSDNPSSCNLMRGGRNGANIWLNLRNRVVEIFIDFPRFHFANFCLKICQKKREKEIEIWFVIASRTWTRKLFWGWQKHIHVSENKFKAFLFAKKHFLSFCDWNFRCFIFKWIYSMKKKRLPVGIW